jgi:hypothetical protein
MKKHNIKHLLIACHIFLLSQLVYAQNKTADALLNNVSKESLKQNVYFLASDQCQGRMAASPGDSIATVYVEQWMKKYALKPGVQKSYRQKVQFKDNLLTQTELAIDGKHYTYQKDWYFATSKFSLPKEVHYKNLPTAFINYAITHKNYSDYDNISVAGKASVNIVGGASLIKNGLLKQQELQAAKSLFKSGVALSLQTFDNPATFGVAAPSVKQNLARGLYGLLDDSIPWMRSDTNSLPRIVISPEMATSLLVDRKSVLDSLTTSVNYLKNDPQAFELTKKVDFDLKTETNTNIFSDNLIGMIEGTDKKAGYIVFTAHRDHEGRSPDSIFYGADDNASGTAALMECAKAVSAMAKKGMRPKKTILFVSTTAEEHGLLGAKYFVQNPTVPLEQIKYNINIDMLGRVGYNYLNSKTAVDSNYVYPLFVDSVFDFRPMLKAASAKAGIAPDEYYLKNPNEGNMFMRSDHYVFNYKKIPAIWFFSGLHPEYHTPRDTPGKINYELLEKRTKMVLHVLWELANE